MSVVFTNGYLNGYVYPNSMVFECYPSIKSWIYRSDYSGAFDLDFTNNHDSKIVTWQYRDKRYWHDVFMSLK